MNNRLVYGLILLLTLSFLCGYASAEDYAYIYTGSNAGKDIAQALVKAGAGSDISVNIQGAREGDIITDASQPLNVVVDNLSFDRAHSSWKATLMPKAEGKNLAPVNLSGSYEEMKQVPVLKRQVVSGEVITADDIDFIKQPEKHLRKNTITDTKELIGKSPKRIISANRAVRMEEIASPAILTKGMHITMIYRSRNLEIKTLGEALDNGAKGDVIRVRNIASKSVVDGVVESGDRVRVSSPESNSAEATP
jgi:flagella basal body P-ring formation protein FlgA